ncbi:MAG: carboxypeptidase regulatory-like domain-containing protein [Planctomycetes bacterium]|nr:carboxypeptidase regulatory-like domain-containing protein [Planctomycetota bacterium]
MNFRRIPILTAVLALALLVIGVDSYRHTARDAEPPLPDEGRRRAPNPSLPCPAPSPSPGAIAASDFAPGEPLSDSAYPHVLSRWSLHVTLRHADGRPASGARVLPIRLLGASTPDELCPPGITDPEGRCRLTLVRNLIDFIRVKLDPYPPVRFPVGDPVPEARREFRLPRFRSMSGMVRSDGRPLAGARLSIQEGEGWWDKEAWVRDIVTGADGGYRFDLVPDGSFTLQIDGSATMCTWLIRAGTQDLAGLDFEVEPSRPVTLKIVDANGTPVRGAQISVYQKRLRREEPLTRPGFPDSWRDDGDGPDRPRLVGRSDAGGGVLFSGLAAGDYDVHARFGEERALVGSVEIRSDPEVEIEVRVAERGGPARRMESTLVGWPPEIAERVRPAVWLTDSGGRGPLRAYRAGRHIGGGRVEVDGYSDSDGALGVFCSFAWAPGEAAGLALAYPAFREPVRGKAVVRAGGDDGVDRPAIPFPPIGLVRFRFVTREGEASAGTGVALERKASITSEEAERAGLALPPDRGSLSSSPCLFGDTDADGRLTAILWAGGYTVSPGHGDSDLPFPPFEVSVRAGEVRDETPVVISPRRWVRLVGRVLSAEGAAAPFAGICARSADRQITFADADSGGAFDFFVPDPVLPLTLQAETPFGRWRSQTLEVPGSRGGLVLVLPPTRTLRGRIVDSRSGGPVHGRIHVSGEGFEWADTWRYFDPDPLGRFAIEDLPAAPVTLTVVARQHYTDPVVVDAGTSEEILIRARKGSDLTVVSKVGEGWITLSVRLVSLEGDTVFEQSDTLHSETGEASATFQLLPPGTWNLQIESEALGGEDDSDPAPPLRLHDGRVTLDPGTTLTIPVQAPQ